MGHKKHIILITILSIIFLFLIIFGTPNIEEEQSFLDKVDLSNIRWSLNEDPYNPQMLELNVEPVKIGELTVENKGLFKIDYIPKKRFFACVFFSNGNFTRTLNSIVKTSPKKTTVRHGEKKVLNLTAGLQTRLFSDEKDYLNKESIQYIKIFKIKQEENKGTNTFYNSIAQDSSLCYDSDNLVATIKPWMSIFDEFS